MSSIDVHHEIHMQTGFAHRDEKTVEDCALIILPTGAERIPKITNMALCVLLDTSSSMRGVNINTAKAAIHYLLDNVDESCMISLITFSTDITKVTNGFEPATVDTVARLRSAVDAIAAESYTNMGDAVLAALEQIQNMEKSMHTQVIVLTDGKSNRGPTMRDIVDDVRAATPKYHAVINTFSVGDKVNANPLRDIAFASAGGVYVHVPTASDIRTKLGELVANYKIAVGHGVKVTVNCCNGARIRGGFGAEYIVESGGSPNDVPKTLTFYCGALYADVKKSLLFTFSLREIKQNEPYLLDADGEQHIADVEIEYMGDIGCMVIQSEIRINRVNAEPKPDNVEITLLRLRRDARNLLDKATQFCDNGEFERAEALIASSCTKFDFARNHPDESVSNLYGVIRRDVELMLDKIRTPESFQQSRNLLISNQITHSTGYGGEYLRAEQVVEASLAQERIDAYIAQYD